MELYVTIIVKCYAFINLEFHLKNTNKKNLSNFKIFIPIKFIIILEIIYYCNVKKAAYDFMDILFSIKYDNMKLNFFVL